MSDQLFWSLIILLVLIVWTALSVGWDKLLDRKYEKGSHARKGDYTGCNHMKCWLAGVSCNRKEV